MSDSDLRELMRDPQYWRMSPEGEALRSKVASGYAERYPGQMPRDATGRQIDRSSGHSTVQVRSYARREPDGGSHTVRAHERRAVQRAWESQPNAEWRALIAEGESTGSQRLDHGYGLRRPRGRTLGRYQIQEAVLRDAGWIDNNGAWTARARSFGVSSDSDFLARPEAQEAALTDAIRIYGRQTRSNGSSGFLGTTFIGFNGQPTPITESGLIAAAHRDGAGRLLEYLRHKEAGLPQPSGIDGQRTNRSAFNAIEGRLQAFATVPFVPPR
jgi:hypothetical protein